MLKSYVKSPLNYVGGKFKLLKHISEYLPSEINTLYDIFGGGYNVGVNFEAKHHVYNDMDTHVVNILKKWYETPLDELLNQIHTLISQYDLSKTNKEGFDAIREYYNNSAEKDPIVLYTIICHAFNYQIRFNSKGGYNMPFGKDRSYFSTELEKKFINYVTELQKQDTTFKNDSFINITSPEKGDFIYADPPYLNSTAAYNEKDGWTATDEKLLLDYLDQMDEKGVKFMLSNNLKYNNTLLEV